MGSNRNLGWLGCVGLVWVMLASGPTFVRAQISTDAEAKRLFEDGKEAFQDADYLGAFDMFRRAYELSKRGELLYNIGLAADRMRRDQEAHDAFEAYLREVDEPSRKEEVQERIRALKRSIATREALANKVRLRRPRSAIIGTAVLAPLGLAGVTAMAVGLGRSGQCVEFSGLECVRQTRTKTGTTAFYGVVGFGALIGAGLWLGLTKREARESRRAVVRLTPSGIEVTGSF